jgi:hypothetical protein
VTIKLIEWNKLWATANHVSEENAYLSKNNEEIRPGEF